jgi:hypothetical protein
MTQNTQNAQKEIDSSIDSEKTYSAAGKLVTLGEFREATSNLMNAKKKTNNLRSLELISITNNLIKDESIKISDVQDCLTYSIKSIESSNNRKMVEEIRDLLANPELWKQIVKQLGISK